MSASDHRAAQVQRAFLDQVEAWQLAPHVGATFDAVVLHCEDDRGEGSRAEVFVVRPPTLARCAGTRLAEGAWIRVRLAAADLKSRAVRFTAPP
jgi:hypothetical protein